MLAQAMHPCWFVEQYSGAKRCLGWRYVFVSTSNGMGSVNIATSETEARENPTHTQTQTHTHVNEYPESNDVAKRKHLHIQWQTKKKTKKMKKKKKKTTQTPERNFYEIFRWCRLCSSGVRVRVIVVLFSVSFLHSCVEFCVRVFPSLMHAFHQTTAGCLS